MRRAIRFLRNGHVVELADIRPDLTLLDHLRLIERTTGPKDGCGEGVCGACTVALGRVRDDHLDYAPIAACTLLAAEADGCDVVTAADIGADDGSPHTIQRALVEGHATGCGFCTPGMVMSLFALWHQGPEPVERATVAEWLAGNLCRCSGYRAAIEAGVVALSERGHDRHSLEAADTGALVGFLADQADVVLGDDAHFLALPASLESLATLAASHPDALLFSGGAEIAPAVLRNAGLAKLILTNRVRDLDRVEAREGRLVLGAGVTLTEAQQWLGHIDADAGTLVGGIGNRQFRSVATLGGCLMGGRAAELAPVLMALGATVDVRRGGGSDARSLDALYGPDGSFARVPGEIVIGISVPELASNQVFRGYRAGRRSAADAGALTAAFRFGLDGRGITEARIAFGGIGPGPRRAAAAEAALIGADIRQRESWTKALAALRNDLPSQGDLGPAGRYLAETAQALVGKALIEAAGTDDRRTRLGGYRRVMADASH